jgi:threonine synthase
MMPRHPKTIASAIMVKTPFNGYTALKAIDESGGEAVKVSDVSIIRAIKELGREGVFAEPASAAALAALKHVDYRKDEKIVLIITGSGLKDPSAVMKRGKS